MDESARIWRARVLLVVAALGFFMLATKLFSMQVLAHADYAQLARENRQFNRRVLAPRGVISDRTGLDLAHNVYHARVTYPRALAVPGDPTLDRLIALLNLDEEQVFQRIDRAPPGDRVTVVRRATPEEVAVVEEHRVQLPNVQLIVEPRRHYRADSLAAHITLAAHIIGYVGEVRRDETGPESLYQPGDLIGRSGVEAFAEGQLRGQHGGEVIEINAAGHIVGSIREGGDAPRPGVHVYLTLHAGLQQKLESLLEEKVGSGVVLEVGTGDILAAASMPSFDANEFTAGISQQSLDKLRADKQKPEFNRAFRGTYPPGSPFKVVTAAAALDRGYVRTSTRFEPCYGGYLYGNRYFGCWNPAGHGSLDLIGAIVQSCDTYFYQLAQRLTVDELAETARQFGFGAPTGLPAIRDHAGLVPTSAWYDERYGRGGWTSGVKLNLGIGQGELLVTPLQMVRAYAAIGGDGYLDRPHLVLARIYPPPDGNGHSDRPHPVVAPENAAGVREKRQVFRSAEPICQPRTRQILQRALHQVVSNEDGTGGLARVAGVAVAGKTGTVENPFGEDHAWFVAYAPAAAPEVAVALIVENAGHGGSVAAPLVRQLLEAYFALSRGEGIGGASP
jgi:penicillin-binding protein 2